MTKEQEIEELLNIKIDHNQFEISPTYVFKTKEQEIAEWTKALHEATSYSGKLYAKYKLRELKK